MKLYKLTDASGRTKNETQWGEGVAHEASGSGKDLCTHDVIHAYRDPLLAAFMNPAHGGFNNPQLWVAEGDVVADDRTKVGCKSLTTIRQVDLPNITTEQRVRFAILIAKEVYMNAAFVKWADMWLSGEDRTNTTAWAAEAWAAEAWAAEAAEAAEASASAAEAAEAEAAEASASAAEAAEAASAEVLDHKINFVAIAHQAVEEIEVST